MKGPMIFLVMLVCIPVLSLGLYFGAMELGIEGFSITIQSTAATNPDAVWEVRWYSRYGEYSSNTQAETTFFTTEDQAQAFAQHIRDAFVLLRYTSGAQVTVNKR